MHIVHREHDNTPPSDELRNCGFLDNGGGAHAERRVYARKGRDEMFPKPPFP